MTIKIDMAKLEGYKLETFKNITFIKYIQEDKTIYAYFIPKNTKVLDNLKRAIVISLRYTHHLKTKDDMKEYFNKSNLTHLPKDSFNIIDNYYSNIINIESKYNYAGRNM